MDGQPGETDQSRVLEGKRVLVVEDEGITLMQLQLALRRAGLVVVGTAINGEQGVEMALRERPDIIIMDINMPGPYNGLEAASRIQKVYRPCLVLLTAYTEHEEQCQQLGASAYLVKPLGDVMFLSELRKAWASSAEADAS
jgi:CheY-like chemotaxis protein